MTFRNPILGGNGQLIRQNIHSENYVAGLAGWQITRDGDAEFNNVTTRGALYVGDSNQYLRAYVAPPPINGPAVVFNDDAAHLDDGYIRAVPGGANGVNSSLMMSSPYVAATENPSQLTLTSGASPSALLFGELDVNGSLVVEPAAGNPIFSVDGTNGVQIGQSAATALSLNGTVTSNLAMAPGKYVKRGGLGIPTFQNSWTNFGSGYQPVRFIEYPDQTAGIVGVASGGVTTQGTVVFAITNAALRPANHHTFDVPCNNGKHAQIVVESGGNVYLSNVDTGVTWFSFANTRWPMTGF